MTWRARIFVGIVAAVVICLVVAVPRGSRKKRLVDAVSRDEKNVAVDIYYGGNNANPTSVLVLEKNLEGRFSIWTELGSSEDKVSPYSGRYYRNGRDIYLIFPTYECRVESLDDGEKARAEGLSYKLSENKSDLEERRYPIIFHKLGTVEILYSQIANSAADRMKGRELPAILQKTFTDASRESNLRNSH